MTQTEHRQDAPSRQPTLTLSLGRRPNEQGGDMIWLASWLVSSAGEEGDWFFSGPGPLESEFAVPPAALAVRLRRWPSNGLDPEYVDVPLSGEHLRVSERELNFNIAQPNSALRTAMGA